jgi:hypothetical protein
MSNQDNGGPAFPHSLEDTYEPSTTGLSIRDYMAAKAMAAMIPIADSTEMEWHDFLLLAQSAYAQADAMLAARGQQ